VRSNGTGARRVSRFASEADFYDASAPAWSPDGRRLVFVASYYLRDAQGELIQGEDDLAGETGLFVANRDGGRARRLRAGAGCCAGPAWSPDGRTLAFVYKNNVALMRADGGPVRVPRRGLRPGPLQYSSDGRKLLFIGRGPNAGRITLLDVRSGKIRRLPQRAHEWFGATTWTPGGKIAYTSALKITPPPPPGVALFAPTELFTISTNGTTTRRLATMPPDVGPMSWRRARGS
jgi:Tol biopolymer transport system component